VNGAFLAALVLLASACGGAKSVAPEASPPPGAGLPRVEVPGPGLLYHGVYPGGASGEEDDVTPGTLDAYEAAAGRRVAWVYFSHEWFRDRRFPAATAGWIRDRGAVPFVRLMLRRDADLDHADPAFGPSAILAGGFDADLRAWGDAARAFAWPVVVEWGTEANGRWFPWNGAWNGGPGEGPRRFREAFRRIVGIVRGQGAENVTWVFHVNHEDEPEVAWNRLEEYYPGDDVVDWVAVSVYGTQTPLDEEGSDFATRLDVVVSRLLRLAPSKPIVVAELGTAAGHPRTDAAAWADAALSSLLSGRWPSVRGFSWWNERFANDEDPRHDTEMRVQAVPRLERVFRERLSDERVVDRPIVSGRAAAARAGPSGPSRFLTVAARSVTLSSSPAATSTAFCIPPSTGAAARVTDASRRGAPFQTSQSARQRWPERGPRSSRRE
jgi:hypothetical protein